MTAPSPVPIGLRLARSAKAVSQAFDAALADGGGSLPVWVILLALKSRRSASQRELAGTVGIRGATLTHHLNAMEREALVTRRRDPGNRRIHLVALTERGEARFEELRRIAAAFDRRLRAGIEERDIAILDRLLQRLAANAG